MDAHARDDRRDSGPEMAQPVAREETSASTLADGTITETRVLARVPALDAATETQNGSQSTSDGRILGQAISTKILLAVGMCIVLVAVGSQMLTRSDSKSGNDGSDWQMESPAPGAPEAPLYGGDGPVPGFVQSAGSMPPMPGMNFQPQVPELPTWADASRVAEESTQTPAMDPGRTSVNATPVGTAPTWNNPQPAPSWQPPTDIPRVSDRTPTWNNRSAPPSTDSEPLSSAWPNPGRMRSPTAAVSGLPATVDATSAYGNRYDSRTSGTTYSPSDRDPQAEANRQFVAPQRVATVPTEYRNRYPSDQQATFSPESRVSPPTWTGRPVEPGVARLEGIIEKPSFRTTDDRARSSVH